MSAPVRAGDRAEVVCSSKGCTASAAWVIAWRNPRIHDATRRKEWAACPDHLDHLRGFLAARSFPLEVRALDDDAPDGS
ncbi:hypothetical protein [Litorihabitans aurantiacus]|uniref:Acetone carboxylase n=1 Tax=Litorihabitans aurantiacus TaxID=1930061 RepID=A0AA37UM51_9MICO|nr:hypothetical protein [Litorihabitans aurantiacus]GMA31045.1 hypothetical protein GCM10025875_10370 [Litorihabitans aurantiacus]